jgi:MoaA/NifB/PqqE/SkfB family radical SAM enzyme
LKVKEVTIAVTHRCNLRCQTCELWQVKDNHYLLPEDYRNLPSSLARINLVGGEPFLREDLPEIIEVLKKRCPKAKITVTTNGVLTRLIEEKVRKMSGIGLKVSINGVQDSHDKICGVRGAFRKAIQTIRRLKSLGLKGLSITTTASKLNQESLFQVKKLSDHLKIGFDCSVHNVAEIAFGDQKELFPQPDSLKRELEKTRDSYLSKFKPEEWVKAYSVNALIGYLEGRPLPVRCPAGSGSFFLQPNGDIYPCKVLNLKMGNIKQGDLEEILENNEHIKEADKFCNQKRCLRSTMVYNHRRIPIKPLFWALSHKFRFELSRLLGNSANGGRHSSSIHIKEKRYMENNPKNKMEVSGG